MCGSVNRAFYCQGCVNKQVFGSEEQQAQIDQLRKRRNALLDSLDKLLALKVSLQ